MSFLTDDESTKILDKHHISDSQLRSQTYSRLRDQIRDKGVSIVWKNLTVVAEIKKKNIFKATEISYKSIIHNVSGAIYPGDLVAIMGASGAGKTTLMSVLSNRCPSGIRIDGDIRINGQSLEKFDKRMSGYVYQDDLFMSSLTVMEHLNFVAKLRLNKNINEEDRRQLILNILREIGLLNIANRRIGNSKFGKQVTNLSGGERKMLSVATELLTEPMLLFCDEPTTGLDSFKSLKTITMLQNLSNNRNKTIVCSIHQPNQQTFQLFKRVILLSHGKIVFNGSPEEAKTFFQNQGYHYDDEQNLAEYFIKSMAIEEDESLHAAFSESEYCLEIKKYVENTMRQNQSEVLEKNKSYKIRPPSWFQKLLTVSRRNFLEIHRNSYAQNIRIIQKTIINILPGLFLHGSVTKTQPGLRAFQGAVVIMFLQNFHPAFNISLSYFPERLPLFYREYSNNSVTPSIFYLSGIITMLPLNIVEPLSFSLIIYLLAGLRSDAYAVMMASLVNILLYNATWTMGVLFSFVCENESVAISYGNPVLNVILFSCAFFVKLSSLPLIISWIRHISWFTYACSAMYILQLKDISYIECDRNENIPCLRTGQDVLKTYSFDKDSISYDLTMIILIYLIFHVASYVCLLFKMKRRRI